MEVFNINLWTTSFSEDIADSVEQDRISVRVIHGDRTWTQYNQMWNHCVRLHTKIIHYLFVPGLLTS